MQYSSLVEAQRDSRLRDHHLRTPHTAPHHSKPNTNTHQMQVLTWAHLSSVICCANRASASASGCGCGDDCTAQHSQEKNKVRHNKNPQKMAGSRRQNLERGERLRERLRRLRRESRSRSERSRDRSRRSRSERSDRRLPPLREDEEEEVAGERERLRSDLARDDLSLSPSLSFSLSGLFLDSLGELGAASAEPFASFSFGSSLGGLEAPLISSLSLSAGEGLRLRRESLSLSLSLRLLLLLLEEEEEEEEEEEPEVRDERLLLLRSSSEWEESRRNAVVVVWGSGSWSQAMGDGPTHTTHATKQRIVISSEAQYSSRSDVHQAIERDREEKSSKRGRVHTAKRRREEGKRSRVQRRRKELRERHNEQAGQ
jgi:hypothetical protein